MDTESDKLREALAVVLGQARGTSLGLEDALRVLDARARQGGLDPQMQHFLERRSYQKAWELLQTGSHRCH